MNSYIIEDKKSLDDFITGQNPWSGQFLQSWIWGEFQKSLGRPIRRLGINNEENQLSAATLLISQPLPFGCNYLYSPKGPIIAEESLAEKLSDEVSQIANQEKSLFWRTEPLVIKSENHQLKKTKEIQPSQTILLDLAKPEDRLLAEMHPKTRYNIGLAQKKGIKVFQTEDKKYLEDFCRLIKETSGRDRFNPHPAGYYAKMMEALSGQILKLFIAQYQDKILVINFVVHFGKVVTYLHGASSNFDRNLMTPYLAQWETIRWAKNNGFELYDFWGVAPADQPNHPWQGLSRFKRGFGGQAISYPGAYDLIFRRNWYKLYNIVRTLR